MRNRRPPKVNNLLERVRSCIDSGRYLDTVHSSDRTKERQITRPEILHVLSHGYHEKSKDQFSARYKAWDYAIRGKTLDAGELRVVVTFDDSGLLIITAIDLRT